MNLIDSWASAPDTVTGRELAMALMASAGAIEEERSEESVEIVWTGPRTTQVPVRLTREALLDVIRAATRELVIVSFAAYRIEVVVEALTAALESGVTVRLILEGARDEGGTLSFGASSAFHSLRQRAHFYIWPLEKRPALEQGRAALHAKAAVADDRVALVTSANLTGHAIGENMELGLLIRGGAVPRRLATHFRELIAMGDLVDVPYWAHGAGGTSS